VQDERATLFTPDPPEKTVENDEPVPTERPLQVRPVAANGVILEFVDETVTVAPLSRVFEFDLKVPALNVLLKMAFTG